MFDIFIAGQNSVKVLTGCGFMYVFLRTLNKFFFIYFSKMPTFNKNQKEFYSTRREVLKKFRDEEKQPCFFREEEWAKQLYKKTSIYCIRKQNLKSELERKCFWTDLKALKFWKVRRQGQYKELTIAPVYLNNDETCIRNSGLEGTVF